MFIVSYACFIDRSMLLSSIYAIYLILGPRVRMLASPGTLLQRSLKMNDYALSRELLRHFPGLLGGEQEAKVRMAEQFKELRERLLEPQTEVRHS